MQQERYQAQLQSVSFWQRVNVIITITIKKETMQSLFIFSLYTLCIVFVFVACSVLEDILSVLRESWVIPRFGVLSDDSLYQRAIHWNVSASYACKSDYLWLNVPLEWTKTEAGTEWPRKEIHAFIWPFSTVQAFVKALKVLELFQILSHYKQKLQCVLLGSYNPIKYIRGC